jgi:hypothetical protein
VEPPCTTIYCSVIRLYERRTTVATLTFTRVLVGHSLLLQSADIAHASLTQEFLELVAVRNGATNLWDELFWNIENESTARPPSIQRVTAVASASGACRTVLSYAGTLSQGQGSRCERPKILHRLNEPPLDFAYMFVRHVCVTLLHIYE